MIKNERVLDNIIFREKFGSNVGLGFCGYRMYSVFTDKKKVTFGRKILRVIFADRVRGRGLLVFSIFIIDRILQMLLRDIGDDNFRVPISPEAFGEFWSIIKMNFIDYFYFLFFYCLNFILYFNLIFKIYIIYNCEIIL